MRIPPGGRPSAADEGARETRGRTRAKVGGTLRDDRSTDRPRARVCATASASPNKKARGSPPRKSVRRRFRDRLPNHFITIQESRHDRDDDDPSPPPVDPTRVSIITSSASLPRAASSPRQPHSLAPHPPFSVSPAPLVLLLGRLIQPRREPPDESAKRE